MELLNKNKQGLIDLLAIVNHHIDRTINDLSCLTNYLSSPDNPTGTKYRNRLYKDSDIKQRVISRLLAFRERLMLAIKQKENEQIAKIILANPERVDFEHSNGVVKLDIEPKGIDNSWFCLGLQLTLHIENATTDEVDTNYSTSLQNIDLLEGIHEGNFFLKALNFSTKDVEMVEGLFYNELFEAATEVAENN